MIGVQDLHEVRGCVAIVGPAERDGERYAATRPSVKRLAPDDGSSTRDSCAPRAAQHTIPAREDDEPRTPMNTTLRTTIAGSLPKPGWLAEPRGAVGRTLEAGRPGPRGRQARRRTAGAARPRQAGIDIVSDGEQTRRHFVTTFIEGLDGVDFEHKRTVRIRNRYDATVPVVVGAVARRHPIFVDDAAFLQAQTTRPVKYTLPGPMTMVDTLHDALLAAGKSSHGRSPRS